MKWILVLITILAAPAAQAEVLPSSAGNVQVDTMISGLDEPWAIAFTGEGVLVTERAGKLWYFADGGKHSVEGVPEVWSQGQGGLLDVVVARDFAQTRTVFLSFSKPRGGGAATAVAVAKLADDGMRLEDMTVIFEMRRATGKGQHFGSRIVEATDGTLFVTLGDRGERPAAQDPGAHNGKVIRIARDGSIPSDNPFVNGGALPEIWSLGHRNPQGATLDEQGRLWTVAHGAQGGDEVNTPEAGRNYGWPVISYGVHYSGRTIGDGAAKDGMEQPKHYWDPSIAPSGMMIYSGRLFPEWKGDIFVGSLKFDMISRLERDGNNVTEAERLFQDTFIRIRDIREAPDGTIWFLAVGDGAAYRISPRSGG